MKLQQCILCFEKSTDCLCTSCQAHLPQTAHRCLCCAIALNTSHQYCASCLTQNLPVNCSWAIYDYDKTLAYLIKQFKYKRRLEIGAFFASQLSKMYAKIKRYNNYQMIIPMPIHRKRIAQRGFNQSIELTRHLERQYPQLFDHHLVARCKNTPSLTGLTLKQRQQQIKNTFIVRTLSPAINNVLLIDDVMTTGSSFNELAKTIKKNYPHIQFDALCLARAQLN